MQQDSKYKNPYSATLISSKNLIFRGAPGTGKSYLAKQIAADIISNGDTDDYTSLTDEQKEQMEFVQFHPGYDYSDFVEGLRPKINADGSMGFELLDGIFKKFVARARTDYEEYQMSKETTETQMSVQENLNKFPIQEKANNIPVQETNANLSVQEIMDTFFETVRFNEDIYNTERNRFTITGVDDKHIYIHIPQNKTASKLALSRDEVRKMLESSQTFHKAKELKKFFGKKNDMQSYSYDLAIYKLIKKYMANGSAINVPLSPPVNVSASNVTVKPNNLKKYIFIIDEINRGEISKIFGELFFAIDPDYRGRAGEISTQFSNMHSDAGEKFYIPENVYIIGTMNDIDRSVDTFDFAMRRRFRFVEIKANEHLEMLSLLGNKELEDEAKRRMVSLNDEIASIEDLNENYQIGASYFLKLKILDFDPLWTDYLEPLLQEYIRGLHNEEEIMKKFADAYGYLMPAKDI